MKYHYGPLTNMNPSEGPGFLVVIFVVSAVLSLFPKQDRIIIIGGMVVTAIASTIGYFTIIPRIRKALYKKSVLGKYEELFQELGKPIDKTSHGQNSNDTATNNSQEV